MTVRTIRCLDGLTWCGGGLLVLLVLPQGARDQLGRIDWLGQLPALGLAWFAWRLPAAALREPLAIAMLVRLRLCALACAGLYPFLVWWQRTPDSLWLLVQACLAVGFLLLTFYHQTLVLSALARQQHARSLARFADFLKLALLYPCFCGFGALAAADIIQIVFFLAGPDEALYSLKLNPFVQLGWALGLLLVALAAVLLPLLTARALAQPLAGPPAA
jgi:hypothetical protein